MNRDSAGAAGTLRAPVFLLPSLPFGWPGQLVVRVAEGHRKRRTLAENPSLTEAGPGSLPARCARPDNKLSGPPGKDMPPSLVPKLYLGTSPVHALFPSERQGNGVARTRAFPSTTWERGIEKKKHSLKSSVILSLSKDQPPADTHFTETVGIFRELILRQAQDDGILNSGGLQLSALSERERA